MTTNTDAPRPTDDATPLTPTEEANVRAAALEGRTHSPAWMLKALATLAAVTAERDRNKAIVDRLPKTADEVPITPGMTLHVNANCSAGRTEFMVMEMRSRTQPMDWDSVTPIIELELYRDGYWRNTSFPSAKCYSTREAALASLTAPTNDSPAMAEIIAAFKGTDAEGGK
jgi:hypothetical protein